MQTSQTLNLVRAGCSLCEKQLGYWSSTALALIQKDQAEYLYRMALDRKFRTPAKNGDGGGCFPATSHYTDMVTGEKRRHHLHESVLQQVFKEARLKAGVFKPPARTFCAIHLLRTC
jgi:hypothetical protein